MIERAILLTIRQRYAGQIIGGPKRHEYRKRPPRISRPTRTIMYVPEAGVLIGEFTMRPASGPRTPLGFALPVDNPITYKQPIEWRSVRTQIPGIRRPQRSFRYIDPADAADARLLEMLPSPR
jgi:predicted transcriptional regulator